MPLAENTRNVHTYSDVRLSPEQVAQVLWQAGIHDTAAIAQLIPIARRESGFRAGVQGTTQPRGAISGDMGLFQINWGAHGENLLRNGIIRNGNDLYDPVINARAAAFLSGNGNPQRMLQLWGVRNGTWAGTNGTLPAPDWGPVNNAQSSGILTQPYSNTGGGPPPGSPGGNAMPPPGANIANQYYNSLYEGYANDQLTNQLLTQSQADYTKGQGAFQQQLAGYQQQALGYQQQQLDVENTYQNDLALLNRNLTKKQRDQAHKQWRTIASNIVDQQKLAQRGRLGDIAQYQEGLNRARQGYAWDAENYRQTQKLDDDILKAAQAWLGKQKGFNQQDYKLALDAIKNVLTTEAARWGEVQRTHGEQVDLARQKREFVKTGATADYQQAVKEAAFVQREQAREAKSEATAAGALTSRGHGEDLAAFNEQRALAGSEARNTLGDVMRTSANQLQSELASINQAYRQGRISYQDAARQAGTARGRAALTYNSNAGRLGYEGQQAGFTRRGNTLENLEQWRNQQLAYQADVAGTKNQLRNQMLAYDQNRLNLNNQFNMGRLGYLGDLNNLSAEAERAGRQQAYNNAIYGINTSGLRNTGRIYSTQAQQQAATTQWQADQAYLSGAQNAAAIEAQRNATFGAQWADQSPYGNYPPSSGTYPGSGGGRGSRPGTNVTSGGFSVGSNPWRNVDPNADVYIPPYD